MLQQQQRKSRGQKPIATDNRGYQAKQNRSWSRNDMTFQGGGRRFQGKSITNSPASRHIFSNSKCRTGKRSSPNKTLVFKRDVNRSSGHSSSWKYKSLLNNLAKADFKPGHSVSGKGLQNTILQDTFSTENSKFYKDEPEANRSCGFGVKGDVEEWGNNGNSTCSREVFEQLIPYGEKRRTLSPCDKSKNVEPVHSFSPFQNGRPFSVKAHNTVGRLDVQTGHEGCILQCPIRLKLNEVRKVSVEGDSLKIYVSVFWARLSTKGVYKVIENSNLSPEYQSDNIFGRYVDFESHNTRSSHEPRHSHISPAEFGLYNKCKEINFAPMSENRISGNGDRFNQNDFVIDTREGTKSCQDLSEPSQEPFYNSSGIDQGCWSPIIHNASSGT